MCLLSIPCCKVNDCGTQINNYCRGDQHIPKVSYFRVANSATYLTCTAVGENPGLCAEALGSDSVTAGSTTRPNAEGQWC